MNSTKYTTIDEYISGFPADVTRKLIKMRKCIKKAAPEASEKISYNMPTFYFYGNLVHFAAYKDHIGFYPAPSGIKAFESRMKKYKTSKGAVQFPLDGELPLELVYDIVKFRVEENLKNSD